MSGGKPLRSQAWFGGADKDGFIHRSWMKNSGLPEDAFDGRPIIGVCNTFSELTPCNAHFRGLAEHVKRGVLEAGGCYVPLDPVLPAARLAAILEAARPAVVVTEERLAAGLPPCESVIVALDTVVDDGDPGREPGPEPGVPPEPANPAYVLFTSGSTGRPKGVVVEHRQIAGYVDAIGFTRLFQVFPANQSGNAVLLGIAIGDPSWQDGSCASRWCS